MNLKSCVQASDFGHSYLKVYLNICNNDSIGPIPQQKIPETSSTKFFDSYTPIGPIPGPPPPWGIQNVLWRFKWETSDP